MSDRVYMVVVHMPHRSIICPFEDIVEAQKYFNKLVIEAAIKYGSIDANGATAQYCKQFGYFEIKKGYFVQLYEAEFNTREEIKWLDISNWK